MLQEKALHKLFDRENVTTRYRKHANLINYYLSKHAGQGTRWDLLVRAYNKNEPKEIAEIMKDMLRSKAANNAVTKYRIYETIKSSFEKKWDPILIEALSYIDAPPQDVKHRQDMIFKELKSGMAVLEELALKYYVDVNTVRADLAYIKWGDEVPAPYVDPMLDEYETKLWSGFQNFQLRLTTKEALSLILLLDEAASWNTKYTSHIRRIVEKLFKQSPEILRARLFLAGFSQEKHEFALNMNTNMFCNESHKKEQKGKLEEMLIDTEWLIDVVEEKGWKKYRGSFKGIDRRRDKIIFEEIGTNKTLEFKPIDIIDMYKK